MCLGLAAHFLPTWHFANECSALVIISPARTDEKYYYQSEPGMITIIIISLGRTDISAGMSSDIFVN